MILLEKVVEKLATIASLHADQEDVQNTEAMEGEDLGVLSMLRGKDISKVAENDEDQAGASKIKRAKTAYVLNQTVTLETHGVSEEDYLTLDFNVLELNANHLHALAVHIFSSQCPGVPIYDKEDEALFARFVTGCQKAYPDNPFHNFKHAVDVLHAVALITKLISADGFLSELQQFALQVAALGHDLKHIGLNNGFLSEVSHELAMRYNDHSPLENMHCAHLYVLVSKPETNIFKSLTKEEYREVRKICIDTILHTDMMSHQTMVKDLNLVYQINSEVFRAPGDEGNADMGSTMSTTMRKSRRSVKYSTCSTEPDQVFSQPETRLLVMETILHSADVSNPARAWPVTKGMAFLCLEEFFAQGDQEKALGVPVQYLNDRDKLNQPNSQIGFIEFMIAPFFVAQILLWPQLHIFGENISMNIEKWEAMWLSQEGAPPEEEVTKVRGRVQRVKESLSNSALRITS
eukprot:TRINITY_DN24466_c0_g1_i2.p1 TRINITY_DN24466_c0_g1~~TRINITY_DN24466_c0_g1_i2.p1  ORF type:complete len:463 (+),score=65.28 TRINITY_DN24466_c0_g1_i2:275-1663(+)